MRSAYQHPDANGLKAAWHGAGYVSLLVVLALGGCAQQPIKAPTAAKTYTFWPQPPDDPHIQFLTAYNSSQDVSNSRSKFDEMLYGKTAGLTLVKPYGIAIYNGSIYVTDLRTPGVVVFDLKQNQTRLVGVGGAADIQKAVAIAIAPDGAKYVIDSGRSGIVVFDAQDRYITSFVPANFNPVDLAVFGNELFVSDFTGSTVKVLDRATGRELRRIGKAGPNDGEFVRPLSVRLDQQGNVYVADVFKCRIQKFSNDGKLLLAFGEAGNRPGEFVRPKHMAIDRNGLIYVVDAAFNNVQVFDPAGKIIGFFGSRGTYPGAMDLPAGICITEDVSLFAPYVHSAFQANQILIVSNQFGPAKISVFAEGQLKPGKTQADISSSRLVVTEAAPSTQPTSQPISIGVPLPPEMMEPTTKPAQPNR